MDDEKVANARKCDKCKERPTIHPNSPLCPRCMGALAKRKKVNTKGSTDGRSSIVGQTRKPEKRNVLVIDFGKHEVILERLRALAEREFRSIELQAMYLISKGVQDGG